MPVIVVYGINNTNHMKKVEKSLQEAASSFFAENCIDVYIPIDGLTKEKVTIIANSPFDGWTNEALDLFEKKLREAGEKFLQNHQSVKCFVNIIKSR